jgi:hypothetical protein
MPQAQSACLLRCNRLPSASPSKDTQRLRCHGAAFSTAAKARQAAEPNCSQRPDKMGPSHLLVIGLSVRMLSCIGRQRRMAEYCRRGTGRGARSKRLRPCRCGPAPRKLLVVIPVRHPSPDAPDKEPGDPQEQRWYHQHLVTNHRQHRLPPPAILRCLPLSTSQFIKYRIQMTMERGRRRVAPIGGSRLARASSY